LLILLLFLTGLGNEKERTSKRKRKIFGCGFAAPRFIPDRQSARRRIAEAGKEFPTPAECNSAIRQIENLRYQQTVVPPLGNFQKQWIKACKSDLKTACDFDYSGKMIEMMLLGLVAYRVGKKVNYDGATGRCTDCSEANELLRRTYRPGWTLNG
jgi:hypothetical protein